MARETQTPPEGGKERAVKTCCIDGRRYQLEGHALVAVKARETSTGHWIDAIYLLPRSRVVIVETRSQWDDGHGRSIGTQYHIADQTEIGDMAERFDLDELRALLPLVEA